MLMAGTFFVEMLLKKLFRIFVYPFSLTMIL